MSSSGLFAICRLARLSSSPTRLPSSLPSLTACLRGYSTATPPQPDPPRVVNNSEVQASNDGRWYANSKQYKSSTSAYTFLNPYSGRSVNFRGSMSDSLRVLDGILARNKVRLQLRMTDRHEKKGYKRRRLASERWRNQFANEVRKKVQLVMKMRDRGA